jgi:hypothetical protein
VVSRANSGSVADAVGVGSTAMLGPDDFIEAFDDLHDFLGCGTGQEIPNAFNR